MIQLLKNACKRKLPVYQKKLNLTFDKTGSLFMAYIIEKSDHKSIGLFKEVMQNC